MGRSAKSFRAWMKERGYRIMQRSLFQLWRAGFKSGEANEREECVRLCEQFIYFEEKSQEDESAKGTVGVYKNGALHYGDLSVKTFAVVAAIIAEVIRSKSKKRSMRKA